MSKLKRNNSSDPIAFPEDINWELLKRFLICASSKSFREATDKIGTSPSALGKQMEELENILGVHLFERVNDYRSNQLTHHGQLYYNYTKDIYFHLQELFTTIRRESEKKKTIRLITTPGLAEHSLPKFLAAYKAKFQDVEIQIEAKAFAREIAPEEIMIRSGFSAQDQIVKKFLFSHKMHFYASKSYVEEYGSPEKLEELINHKNLALEGGKSRNTNKGTFFLNRLEMFPDFSSNSLNLLFQLCKMGKGVLELPDIFRGVNELEKVLEGEPSTLRNIYIGYHPKIASQAHIANFLHFAEEFYKSAKNNK